MTRVIGSHIFLFLYLTAMLRPVVPFIEYGIKYDYISKILCINKDKPELKCNGKCQLSKKLIETNPTDSENKSTPPSIKFEDCPITYLNSNKYATQLYDYLIKKDSYFNENRRTKNYIKQIFHPPKFLV